MSAHTQSGSKEDQSRIWVIGRVRGIAVPRGGETVVEYLMDWSRLVSPP
jgi:hypothetical protein